MLLVKICMKVEIRALRALVGSVGVIKHARRRKISRTFSLYYCSRLIVLVSGFSRLSSHRARVSFLVFRIWKLGICRGARKPSSGLMHAEKHILFPFLFITSLL